MELTPRRQALIDAHVAETRRLMLDCAFEMNDLVRFALSAAREKSHKVYYPMDPVNEGIRHWDALGQKLDKLAARVRVDRERMRVQPFDPEEPEGLDDPTRPSPNDVPPA